MKFDKDQLKKHHYWLVAGFAVLLVFVAYFSITGVSENIAANEKEIKDAGSKTGATPPGKKTLEILEANRGEIAKMKDVLWAESYNRQKPLLVWPKPKSADLAKTFADYSALKFGEKNLKDFTREPRIFGEFREAYDAAYAKLGADLEPILLKKVKAGNAMVYEVFAERQVTGWVDAAPEPQQIWLALEDFWVAKEMLEPLGRINDQSVKFVEVPAESKDKLNKTFQNRFWKVKLSVDAANKNVKATITNRLKEMQPLGSKGVLNLKITLNQGSKNPEIVPFQIAQIPGETSREFQPYPIYGEVDAANSAIFSVEYAEKDNKLVPIRQVDQLSYKLIKGQFGTFNKATLVPPSFWTDKAATDPASANQPSGAVAAPPALPGFRGGEGGPIGGGTPAAGGADGKKPIERVVDDYAKTRYVEVNPQLRRMPVAIKMIVDYRAIPEILVAYANSPLRMQVVNYNANRFRGKLYDPPVEGVDPAAAAGNPTGAAALPGGRRDGEATIDTIVGGNLGRGEGGGFRGSIDSGALSATPAAEVNADSTLVELYIFGIITLYEAPSTGK